MMREMCGMPLNYIGSQHTDMMLFLGDNAYNSGTDAEYQTALFFKTCIS